MPVCCKRAAAQFNRSMGRRSKISPDAAAVELVPNDYFAPLRPPEIYGRSAPLEVDLGCGDGTFLAVLAEAFPQRDFLGVERMAGRVDTACRRIARHGLRNARVLLVDTSYAVAKLFLPGSVSAFHLLFPDPWPKRRHQRRRVADDEFVDAIAAALEAGGTFHMATDQPDYFEAVREIAISHHAFTPADIANPFPETTFEKRFRAQALPIYRMVLRKISAPR